MRVLSRRPNSRRKLPSPPPCDRSSPRLLTCSSPVHFENLSNKGSTRQLVQRHQRPRLCASRARETDGVLVVLTFDEYQALADDCASGHRMSVIESCLRGSFSCKLRRSQSSIESTSEHARRSGKGRCTDSYWLGQG